MEKVNSKANIVSATRLKSLPPATEYFQPNVLKGHMHCCIWKHDDEATPPNIQQTMHGWNRGAINKTLEQTLLTVNTSVTPDQPDVRVIVPCCLVQWCGGAKVDWIVLVNTLYWQWKTYLTLKMETNLIISIYRFSSLTYNIVIMTTTIHNMCICF